VDKLSEDLRVDKEFKEISNECKETKKEVNHSLKVENKEQDINKVSSETSLETLKTKLIEFLTKNN